MVDRLAPEPKLEMGVFDDLFLHPAESFWKSDGLPGSEITDVDLSSRSETGGSRPVGRDPPNSAYAPGLCEIRELAMAAGWKVTRGGSRRRMPYFNGTLGILDGRLEPSIDALRSLNSIVGEISGSFDVEEATGIIALVEPGVGRQNAKWALHSAAS
jgi:hypothetical protein